MDDGGRQYGINVGFIQAILINLWTMEADNMELTSDLSKQY